MTLRESTIDLSGREPDSGNGGGGGGGNTSDYAFPGFTGNDDTAILQEFLNDMGVQATSEKRQLKLILPENSEGLIQGVFARSNTDLNLNGSRLVKIRNADYSGAGAGTARSTIIRAQLLKTGNSWYGTTDNVTIRNGVLDCNNKDNLAVLDLYNVRNFRADQLTLITSQWSRNWATRGGGYAVFTRGQILGQAGLFQDGAHWQYGGCVWDDWYIESGDDALAAGDDAVSANVYMDDVHLEYFIARNIRVKAARGAALKVYTAATKPFSAAPNNYTNTGKVKNVDVQVTGKAGMLRNGGVSIFSHVSASGVRNPDDLRGIRVHADLEVGTNGKSVWDAVSGELVGNPTSVTAANPVVVTLANHGLAAGKVVHLIPDIGGMSNLNGFYQVMATNLTANTFQLSDIAYRNNAGLNGSGFVPWTTGKLLSVGSGTGYQVGQDLTLEGGTYIRPAVYRITQVNEITGAVEAIRRIDEGEYSVLPASPNSPTGGTGTGALLYLFLEHDGVNAYGVKSYAGKDAQISGNILINDTTNANATRFRSFHIIDSESIRVNTAFPKVPMNGGMVTNESIAQLSKRNIIDSHMVCNGPLNPSMSPVMLMNSADTLVSGSIRNLPAGGTAVSFPIGGNVLHPRNIVGITGESNSVFQVAHGNWKAGQIVRIYNNVLSTGTLDGYYIIRRVYGDSSFGLRTLAGAMVGLGAATVTTLGNIEVANNTCKLENLTIMPAGDTDAHVGVNAAANTPSRLSAITIADCNFGGIATAVGSNVLLAPCGYISRDNRF